MKMSIFEVGMLLCFGTAWPLSIYKSLKSQSVEGKSLRFLIVVFAGYVLGVLHKMYYYYDQVIYLYIFNGMMIFVDMPMKKQGEEASGAPPGVMLVRYRTTKGRCIFFTDVSPYR